MDNAPQTGDPMFPVAQISTWAMPNKSGIILRLDFVTNLLQGPADANVGRLYALTLTQAEHLVQQISGSIHALQSAAPPRAEDPPH